MRGKRSCLTAEELVDRHLDSVYRFAYRLTHSRPDAEDLVQETMLIATSKIEQLRDPRCALPWLFQILRSCLAHRPRSLGRRISLSDVELEAPEADERLDDVDRDQLLSALEEMPDDYRQPLLLFYFDQLKYREIAEALECPIGTVMSRIARGKAYLRSRLVPESVR